MNPVPPSPDPGPPIINDPIPSDPTAPEPLLPPVFDPLPGKYPIADFRLTITLNDPNPDGKAELYYSINGRRTKAYQRPFRVHPDTVVTAFAQSLDPERYLDSQTVNALYEAELELFSGQAGGGFSGARRDDDTGSGTSANVEFIEDGGTSRFEWGTPVRGTPPNSLQFQGSTIVGAQPEELFPLGDLVYFNGSVYNGSEAHEVTLNVELNLTSPALATSIPYVFELENTVNRGNDPDADADFVRIKDPSSPIQFTLNQTDYYLVLQFGDVGRNGFSTLDQFHVHEGKSASTRLYGYFTENPPE